MAQDRTRASLELLYNISHELVSSLDLYTVLSRVLFLSINNVGAERGSLVVLDEAGKPIEAAIVYGNKILPHNLDQIAAILDQGLAGWVLRNKKPVLIPDTSQDERWLRRQDDASDRSGAKSAMCVPLMVRDQLVGVLTIVHSLPGFFKDEHLALAKAISEQSGIAIHNARLYSSLQLVNRRYRELFEDSIDPILITAWNGRIIESNRQVTRMTGYDFNSLLKKTVFDLHKVRRDKLGEDFSNLLNGQTISYEGELQCFNAVQVPVDVYVRKVALDQNNYLQWIFRDISARKSLDALREDLTAMIYHDLRSPLSNIISSLEMIQSLLPYDQDPNLEPIFMITRRSTDRMQRMISSLLDIERLESGQPISNQKETILDDLINDAMQTIMPVIENKMQTLTVKISPEMPALWVDADMIRRVLINLLENAAKFTPNGGEIVIGGSCPDNQVHLWVQDNGPGIPEVARELIFDKFSRLKTENSPKGLGLGLAFCRLAVEAHGGKIWVESKMGAGSHFEFTLPVFKK